MSAPTSTEMALPALWRRIILAVLALLALGVGLFRIDRPAPWVDEAVTVLVVRRPWGGIPPLLQGADAPLVPYYLLAKAWASMLSWLPTLVAVRTLSAVAAALTVAALFTIVARLNGVLAGSLAAVILTSLAGFSRYAQEARPYALLIMTSTLAWLAWEAWRRPQPGAFRQPSGWRRELGRAAAYLVSLIGSVLFHLFGLFQWPAQLLADLVLPGRPRAERVRRAFSSAVTMVVAAVLVGVPLVFAATRGTGAPRLVPMTPRQLLADFGMTLDANNQVRPALVVLALVLLAVVAVAARARVARRYSRLVAIAVIWVVVPLVLSVAAAAVRPALLRARYWMPLVVPMSALAAVGLLVLAGWTWRAVLRGGGRRTLAAVAASLVVVVPLAVHTALQAPAHLSIRRAGGHALSLAPALEKLDGLLAEEPDLPVATTPYTRTTILWAARPDLIAPDPLFRLDERGTEVWPKARDAADVAQRLKGHNTMLWVRARIAAAGTVPTPKPTTPPKALQQLGFTVVSAERAGSWWVCILQR